MAKCNNLGQGWREGRAERFHWSPLSFRKINQWAVFMSSVYDIFYNLNDRLKCKVNTQSVSTIGLCNHVVICNMQTMVITFLPQSPTGEIDFKYNNREERSCLDLCILTELSPATAFASCFDDELGIKTQRLNKSKRPQANPSKNTIFIRFNCTRSVGLTLAPPTAPRVTSRTAGINQPVGARHRSEALVHRLVSLVHPLPCYRSPQIWPKLLSEHGTSFQARNSTTT